MKLNTVLKVVGIGYMTVSAIATGIAIHTYRKTMKALTNEDD